MSTATLTPAAGGFHDPDLAAFLAQVPAARDYDLAELDVLPRKLHRPGRTNDKRRAIDESLRGEA